MTLPENVRKCLDERKYNISLVMIRDGTHSAMNIDEEFNPRKGSVNICSYTADKTQIGVVINKYGGSIDNRLEEFIRETICRIDVSQDAEAFYNAFSELADKSGRF